MSNDAWRVLDSHELIVLEEDLGQSNLIRIA